MKKEEFEKIMYKEAVLYAYNIIKDPDDHLDAVGASLNDFFEGAIAAWNFLKSDCNDERAIC